VEIDSETDLATRNALFEQVRRHTGIAMNERKWPLLAGRLRRRLHALALPDYRDYLRVLEDRPDEVLDFIDLVTTNETSFFRTPRIWDYFSQQFLPQWSKANPGGTLRLWSAAASSGEEAYSAAMLCEEFRRQHPAFQYRILATDIGGGILRKAALGHYQGRSIETFRVACPDLFGKYFRPEQDGFSVDATLRAHITFRKHNLHEVPRDIGPIEFALLRNVLIYFDAPGQLRVLENVRRAMTAGGTLVIGESESLSRFETGFMFEQPLIYRNRGGAHGRSA
jgi:chemotaxis protein methyltransferase CheR